MTPSQLLEKLENLGIIESSYLERVRKEVEKSDKHVKPKAILKYLVKKNQITEQQAKMLLQSDSESKQKDEKSKKPADEPKKTEDEIEVVQPVEVNYDTDDLTGLVNQPEEEAGGDGKKVVPEVVVDVDHGATLIDDGGFADEVAPEVMVSSVFDPIPIGNEVVQQAAPINYGPVDDGGFDSGGYETDSGEQQIVQTFVGKRDKSDQWATKWLYIGFGILGTVLIGSGLLWIVNSGQVPEEMFEAAMDSFNKQSYADAAEKFGDYLEEFPSGEKAATCRALRVNSIIRSTYGLKNYEEVIQQADTLLPELAEEEDGELNQIREDLSVMIPDSLAIVSGKATKVKDLLSMEKELAKIDNYRTIVENPIYIPPSLRKATSVNDNYVKIDNNIRMLKGQIDKEKRYNVDLVTIGRLDKEKKTDEAFAVYQKLLRNYGDLASREELRTLMGEISKTEQELVVPVELQVGTFQQERPTILESSVVMAVKTGEPVPGLKDEIVSFLVDGSVYGVDAGEGSIRWRRFVGYETSNQPVAINDETIAVSDQRDNDLVALNQRTGDVVWRTEIGEPFLIPTMSDKGIIVTTESGTVIQLNASTGVNEKAVQLPQPANVNALVATRDPVIYQVGNYQNLYVLSSQDFDCVKVQYLGHYEGSVVIPPQVWTGFILVAVNGGDRCDLHVLKPSDNGGELEEIQVLSGVVQGTVSTPLKRFGRWMLLTSDSGEMKLLELYPADEQNPVRVLTEEIFDAKGKQRAFLSTDGSNLWIAGQGIMRYRLRRNLGEMEREVSLEANDTFISPVAKLDDYLLHVRRRNRSGMISVSLVDAMTLKPVWRTDIGGELAGPPLAFGNKVVAVSSQGDMFSIDAASEAAGYNENPVRASAVIEDLKFQDLIRLSSDTFACVGPSDRKDVLMVNGTTGVSKLLPLAKPADKPGCRPIAIGQELIIPTATGQVARIDPKTGQNTGTPFQPPLRPSAKKPQWFEPTLIGEDQIAIAAGATDDGTKSMLYLLSGENQRLKKVGEFTAEKALKSRLVNDGKNIIGVTESENGDKLVSFTPSPLAVGSEVQLDGAVVDGPWMTQEGILVSLDNEKLYCFENDLSPKWSIEMPNDKLACNPEIVGSQLMLCFRNGKVNFVDPSTGKNGTQFDVTQPIIHKPLTIGEKMYFGGMDGTVHVVDLSKLNQP